MSVQVNTYVLWGCLIPYGELKSIHGGDAFDVCEPFTDSAFDLQFNKKNDTTILFDGMNGEYVAVGHVIAKTHNHLSFVQPIVLPRARPSWADDLHRTLSEIGWIGKAFRPGWIIVSHHR